LGQPSHVSAPSFRHYASTVSALTLGQFMFKSFTGSDKKVPAGSKQAVAEPAPPHTLEWAVKLMLAGAAVSTIYLVFGVIVTAAGRSSLINALIKSNDTEPKSKQLSLSQIHTLATFYVAETAIVGVIAIALWLFMARMNIRGLNWARITASVFFLLWTYYTYVSIGQTRGDVTLVVSTAFVLLTWVIGVASLYLLWRPPSTAFFKGQSR
jgi:hypothetical protein